MMQGSIEKESQAKKPSKLLKWIGVLLFGFGLFFVAVAVAVYVHTNVFLTTAIETRGTVTQLLRHERGYTPLVVFTDQTGQEIEYVPNMSSNPPAYTVGEEVVVFYDPQMPQYAMLGGFALYLLPMIFGGVGGIFAVIGLSLVMIYRKRKGVAQRKGNVVRRS